jgi:hypothetical protein
MYAPPFFYFSIFLVDLQGFMKKVATPVVAYKRKESFLVQQFLENAAEVKGEQPLSLPAGSETP